ncbi:universal stress protein [Mesorhizobium sp. L-8-10]|uniref:universal stress protein n=1 Tax=Mesorhizobium sp. L-8-10 TaxID=2744523 RepID=UPI001927CD8F|nr:universal stress protein [Mesorhizobium sp. L-8-10]BCH31955.1 universal stress protein [Mesorhizobium sp. L-8-10]
MTITTIMVQLDVDSPATPRLSFARELAGKFEADLIAVVAVEARALVPPDENGLVTRELLRQRRREIEDRLKVLKEEFLAFSGNNERASWRTELDDPTRTLALHARAADLVVTGTPAAEAGGDFHRTIDAGALILSVGRPVLFAADDLRPLRGERILIAWKDARESRRAVADAMPFLTHAKEVTVAAIAEGDQPAVREGAADVVRFLMRHGVRASSQILEPDGAKIAEVLIAKAGEIGADVVVAGGYGHSRLLEWAFGGVTRSMLSAGSMHRLLSN